MLEIGIFCDAQVLSDKNQTISGKVSCNARGDAGTTTMMNIPVFWDTMPCRLIRGTDVRGNIPPNLICPGEDTGSDFLQKLVTMYKPTYCHIPKGVKFLKRLRA
jgi:hypothetical protein